MMDYTRFAHVRPTPFETWVQAEGLKVITTHTVPDILTAELEPWKRTGCLGALLDMTHDPSEKAMINNQGTTRYIVEIPPGGTFKAEKHMYEEIFYVVKGRGATVVWNEGTPKLTFEWEEDAVFAIPLNTWHEIHNGSGSESVRLYAASNMPTPFNLYGSPEFIFNCANTFNDRFDPNDETFFNRKATKLEDRLLQSNFIPSVTKLALDNWAYRGPGTNMHVLMSGGRFVCHVSEFPPASYKKGHGFVDGQATGGRNRTGLTNENSYLFLSGEGYDLQWKPGVMPGPGVPFERFNFKRGSLMTNGQAGHQHFNPSNEAARYLVLRYGNDRFGLREGQMPAGKNPERWRRPQIEYKEEQPEIRPLFEEECRKRGVTSRMSDL
jgi:mannose-6-phosphate isomerase-like protein (cupin superfamily)